MYDNILLTVDLAHLDDERESVAAAVRYAKEFGSTIHILTVVPDFGISFVGGFFPSDQEKKALQSADRQLHEFTREVIPPDIRHRHIVDHGVIYRIILHYARQLDAELIIMSAGRPELEDYLLGPNAARVVRHAKCSVLVVRPRG